MSEPGHVFLVDDDVSILVSFRRALERCGHHVTTFESPVSFLRDAVLEPPACLVVDLRMAETNGLEVQAVVARRAEWLSVIFVSGCADIRSSVEAMKHGAFDFLVKPFAPEVLVAAVEGGLAQSATRAMLLDKRRAAQDLLRRLSPRERQVADMILAGLRNAEIGLRLGTSEKTVRFHRLNLMRKLEIHSITELVRLRSQAGETPSAAEAGRP